MSTTQTACAWPASHHSDDAVEVWHGSATPLYACGYHLESVGVTRLAQAQHKCRECGTTDLSTNEPTCGTCFNARARREPMVSADELVRMWGGAR